MKISIFFGVVALLFASAVFAKEAELREDPEIKERFKNLTSELRCLKCQNQTIYASGAGLADDLKKQIRSQIYAGKTDEEIIEYMVVRYGDFIRFNPAIDKKNLVLWIGPFVFLLIGGVLLIRFIKDRKNHADDESQVITEEDRLRAKEILKQGGDK